MRSMIEKQGEQTAPWSGSNETAMELFKQAEADNAALVEMLAEVYSTFDTVDEDKAEAKKKGIPFSSILNLLAQPHPGWTLVDQLSKLKQVAEAARPLLSMDSQQDSLIYQEQLLVLRLALADLDGLDEGNLDLV